MAVPGVHSDLNTTAKCVRPSGRDLEKAVDNAGMDDRRRGRYGMKSFFHVGHVALEYVRNDDYFGLP